MFTYFVYIFIFCSVVGLLSSCEANL